jgi:hypothetical protein
MRMKRPMPQVTPRMSGPQQGMTQAQAQLLSGARPIMGSGMSGAGLAGMARPQPTMGSGMSGAGLAEMARPQPPSTTSRLAGLGATGMGARAMGMKKGGKVSSASKRADGCAIKGKTKGKMV